MHCAESVASDRLTAACHSVRLNLSEFDQLKAKLYEANRAACKGNEDTTLS